jgi:histidinol-phosphate aminotransferase
MSNGAELNRRHWIGASMTLLATGASPISRLDAAAPAERARLSLNENAFGPSPKVAAAIAGELPRLSRYLDEAEADRLIDQIAAIERVDRRQIVLGEILEPLGAHLASQAGAAREIVYSVPGYTALVDAAAPFGGRGIAVPLNAALENDLPAIEAAVTGATLAVYLVNPHNPSGTVSDGPRFDRAVLAMARRTLVIVDEAYLEYDAFEALSAVRHVRAGANVAVFRTLGKIYGLAGASIGYVVAPPALADSLRKAGIGDPFSMNRLAVAAAGAALADRAHVAMVRTLTLDGRARLTALLDRLELRHSDSRGNFIFFESALPAAEVRRRFAERGVLIARDFPPLLNWVRITVGTWAENELVERILVDLFGTSARTSADP